MTFDVWIALFFRNNFIPEAQHQMKTPHVNGTKANANPSGNLVPICFVIARAAF